MLLWTFYEIPTGVATYTTRTPDSLLKPAAKRLRGERTAEAESWDYSNILSGRRPITNPRAICQARRSGDLRIPFNK